MSDQRVMRLTAEHVKLCHREVADTGPLAAVEYLADADYRPAAEALLQGRTGKAVWLFAYGSLIWKPEVPHIDMKRAMAQGWHRAFSMQIRRHRGTEAQPGYMMCLDRGGSCEGVVLRLPSDGILDVTEKLLRREITRRSGLEAVRWIDVVTEEGPLQALAFYAAPGLLDAYVPGRPLDEVAYGLARACGHWGSGAEYLFNTVVHLEQLGIHDEGLWALRKGRPRDRVSLRIGHSVLRWFFQLGLLLAGRRKTDDEGCKRRRLIRRHLPVGHGRVLGGYAFVQCVFEFALVEVESHVAEGNGGGELARPRFGNGMADGAIGFGEALALGDEGVICAIGVACEEGHSEAGKHGRTGQTQQAEVCHG